jgi:tetratricopeptide (TPR) repeat protein
MSAVCFNHRLMPARNWQHRAELDYLCRWWRRGGRGVCVLVGIGGSGKTAIVDRFLRLLPDVTESDPDLPKDISLHTPDRLLVFSFYDLPNTDRFFSLLHSYLNGTTFDEAAPTPSFQQSLNLLAGVSSCLLVLDGLERVLAEGDHGYVFGQIIDSRLAELMQRLALGLLPGVAAIVTTRFPIAELEEQQPPLCTSLPVEGLSEETSVALLRDRGVLGSDAELRRIATECGSHALTVDLAAGCLVDLGRGRFQSPLLPQTKIAAEPNARRRAVLKQEYRLGRIVDWYRECLSEQNPAALALLERVCLFRVGVRTETLASIFTGSGTKRISGHHLNRLSKDAIEEKLALLTEMRLLENSSPGYYRTHPAVRDSFLRGLDSKTKRYAHNAARKHLTGLLGNQPGYRHPSDPAHLDLLEEIIYHAVSAGAPKESRDLYNFRLGGIGNLGFELGEFQRGERICRILAGNLSPNDLVSSDLAPSPSLLADWSYYSFCLGDLQSAQLLVRRCARFRRQKKDWRNVAAAYRNLAEICLLQGRIKRAMRYSQYAITLSKRIESGSPAGITDVYTIPHSETDSQKALWIRAQCFALMGLVSQALEDFSHSPPFGWVVGAAADDNFLSQRSLRCAALSHRLGRNEEAIGHVSTTLNGMEFRHHLCYRCIQSAEIALTLGAPETALALLKHARVWSQDRRFAEPFCRGAIVLAQVGLSQFGLWDASGKKHRDASALDDSVRAACKGKPFKLRTNTAAMREMVYEFSRLLDHFHHWSGESDVFPQCSHPDEQEISLQIATGLQVAHECGFGIYRIDLLLLRAQLALYQGRAEDAHRDVTVALFGDDQLSFRPRKPELPAATDPESNYAWGIAHGQHLLGEILLLQAARELGTSKFVPRRLNRLPQSVCEIISKARDHLNAALLLWEKLKYPKSSENMSSLCKRTKQLIKSLNGGVLTNYPLSYSRTTDELLVQPSSTESAGKSKRVQKKHVFLSYCRDNLAVVSALRDDLLAAGEPVWWDQQLLGGQDWKLEIRKAMRDSYAVIVCLSADTANRITSGLYPEILEAIAVYREYAPGSIFIIPVRLSECELPMIEIDATRTLDRIQTIDLFPAANRPKGLRNLITSLQATALHP